MDTVSPFLHRVKALSSLDSTSGGALVRPAAQGLRVSPFRNRLAAKAMPEASEEDVKAQLIAEILAGVFGEDDTDAKSLQWHVKRAEGDVWEGARGRWFTLRNYNGKLKVVPTKRPQGEGGSGGSSPDKPAGKKPAAPKPVKMTMDQARETVAELKQQGPTEERLEILTASLATLTVKELTQLKKEFGIKGGKLKADLIAKIKDTIGAVRDAEEPEIESAAEPVSNIPAAGDNPPPLPSVPKTAADMLQVVESVAGEPDAAGDRSVDVPTLRRNMRQWYGNAFSDAAFDDMLKELRYDGKLTLVAAAQLGQIPPEDLADSVQMSGEYIRTIELPPSAPSAPTDIITDAKKIDPIAESTVKDAFDATNVYWTEKKAVQAYTGVDYPAMNGYLRGEIPESDMDEDVLIRLSRINELMNKAAPFSSPVRTYRGMRVGGGAIGTFIKNVEDHMASGSPLVLQSLQSTTLDPRKAEEFIGRVGDRNDFDESGTPVRMQILAKRGLYIDSISYSQGEKEVLLPARQSYTVRQVRKDADGGYTIALEQQ